MQVLFQSCQLPNRLQTEWILFWSDASCPIQVGLWTDEAADTGIPAWVTLIAICPDTKVLMRICFLFTVCMHGKVFQQEVTCRLISIASACLYCIKQKASKDRHQTQMTRGCVMLSGVGCNMPGWRLQRQTKDCGDAIHCLVLPFHRPAAIGCIVPKTWRCCVETSACIQQDI